MNLRTITVFTILVSTLSFRSALFPKAYSKIFMNDKQASSCEMINKTPVISFRDSCAVDDVIYTLQQWSLESTSLGSAIKCENVSSGVRFSFLAAMNSYLDIVVNKQDDNIITISSILDIKSDNKNIVSLVKLAAGNLIDSCSYNIGNILLTSKFSRTSNEVVAVNDPTDLSIEKDTVKVKESLNSRNLSVTNLLSNTNSNIHSMTSSKLHINTPTDVPMSSSTPSTASTDISKSDIITTNSKGIVLFEGYPKKVIEWPLISATVNAPSSPSSHHVGSTTYDILIRQVQTWSDTFAGRGTGIEADNIANGVVLSFAISDIYRLLLTVSSTDVLTYSKSQSNGYFVLAEFICKSDIETAAAPVTLKLISKAADSLIKSLHTHLSRILLPTEVVVEEETLALSNQQQTGTDKVIVNTTTPITNKSSEETNDSEYLEDDEILPTEVVFDPKSSAVDSSQPQLQSSPQTESSRPWQRKRDPVILERAQQEGLRLENFENKGIEEAAVEELQKMLNNQRNSGLPSYLQSVLRKDSKDTSTITSSSNTSSSLNNISDQLFQEGLNISETVITYLNRPRSDTEDLSTPVTTFPVNLKAAGLAGGIDIMAGPNPTNLVISSNAPQNSLEGQKIFLLPANTETIELDQVRLRFLTEELMRSDELLHDAILDGFRDVLLCDNFVYIMKELNRTCNIYSERLIYNKIVKKATELSLELGELLKKESVRHLETIHDICEVAMKFQQNEERFLRELDELRPRFTTDLLGYLNFAIQEEAIKVKQLGRDPANAPSTWLTVLQVVKQGVAADFEARFDRLLEPLLLVIRFDDLNVKSNLFMRFIEMTAPLDLPYMRALSLNMISDILRKPVDELPDKTLHDRMHQLRRDVDLHLSEEHIAEKIREFESTLKQQGQVVEKVYRDPVAKEELRAYEELLKGTSSLARIIGDDGTASDGSVLDRKRQLGASGVKTEDGGGNEPYEEDQGMEGTDGLPAVTVLSDEERQKRRRYLLGWG